MTSIASPEQKRNVLSREALLRRNGSQRAEMGWMWYLSQSLFSQRQWSRIKPHPKCLVSVDSMSDDVGEPSQDIALAHAGVVEVFAHRQSELFLVLFAQLFAVRVCGFGHAVGRSLQSGTGPLFQGSGGFIATLPQRLSLFSMSCDHFRRVQAFGGCIGQDDIAVRIREAAGGIEVMCLSVRV